MKKKPEKQKKKVVVDEREIEYIGGRPVEYVYPKQTESKPQLVTTQQRTKVK